MDDNSTVDLLIEMARKKRDEAAARMAQSQLRCQEAEKKMGLLDQYLTEYHTRQRGLACTDAILLSNYRTFLERLESAAARQQTDLLMARRNLLQKRQAWERALQHFKSIEVLQERRASTARIAASRAHQRDHDSLAAQMAAYPLAMAG